MDHFKEVNDTFGHGAGDRVLEALTERLTGKLPEGTILGRLAGDEFALFIDGISESSAHEVVRHLSDDILNVVALPFHVGGQEVFLSASIGVALCPRDAENVIDLIRNADAAMYYSKQNGGNSCAFYTPEMNAAAVERLMLKSKLKRAIERDEFVVAYMPKVNIADGRIVGAEALLRWRAPGHGDIPPSQFIPLAEENNLISSIGEWVLDRVCQDYAGLADRGLAPGRIALNLSLKQLRQASFILDCKSLFARRGVSPRQLELEITETTLMADPKRTIGMLRELAAMGLHLSIDDFGTGYSSLSALQQFPIGTLKIDQSFVRDVNEDRNDATIVRTIIDMGHSLGMQVVAEGVETVAQLEFLDSAGCDQAQGQLFGEPCSIDTLSQLLAQQNAIGASPFPHFARKLAAGSNLRA
jgi:diguanylate cyclase (GGDEF)-like protein